MEKIIDNIEKAGAIRITIQEGDYTDEKGFLICGKCNTPKQGEVEFMGQKRRPFILCECEKARKNAEEAEREKERQRIKLEERRRKAFPPEEKEKMLTMTFANDDMENERTTKAMRKYVENFAEFRKQGKGLLLYGDTGRGKTYAACEIANALIDDGYSVIVTNFSRVLNTLQGTFEKQEYLDSLCGVSLLVIDDLGIERGTDYAKENVYSVIDSRYRAGKPMIITTNLTIEQLKNPNDIKEKRVFERVLERCFPIECKGKNRRYAAIRNEYKDMEELLGL